MFDNNKNQLDDFFGLQQNSSPENKENIKSALEKKSSWRTKMYLLPKTLSFRERYLIFILLLIVVGSVMAIPLTTYFHFTSPAPAYGGTVVEGVIGEPRFINPLLSQSNDADRDLQTLIYSGLLKYNSEGKLIPSMAKSYEISADGLSYTVYLKENLFWHDGTPLTAEDVAFTVQTAQNPDYVSPQNINWHGIDIELVNDRTLIFKLKNKYGQFLNNLTLGIIPKHLWQDVKPINFNLSELNLKPIGSGPFVFNKLKKDKLGHIISYSLTRFDDYHEGKPYLENIEIKFYATEDGLINAFNSGDVDSLSFISANNLEGLKFKKRLTLEKVKLPRYYVMFFNQNQSKFLSDKNVRQAISYAVDRNTLTTNVLHDNGIPIFGPLPSEIFGIPPTDNPYPHNPEKAKAILASAGWNKMGEDGVRLSKPATPEKGKTAPAPERLSIKLATSTWPELGEVARIIKEQLLTVGIEISIEVLPISRLQQAIKERDYEVLLFGEILNIDPDLLTLWHSSQKRDPGLNFALYDNKDIDKLLEEARQTLSPLQRLEKYTELQNQIAQDIPAVFLYSQLYLYGLSSGVKGFDTQIIATPSDRLSGIAEWYVQTQRVWK